MRSPACLTRIADCRIASSPKNSPGSANPSRDGSPIACERAACSMSCSLPDGSWLVTATSEGAVRVRDRATGQLNAVLANVITGVDAVAVAPDGSWLAVGCQDPTARVRDPATAEQRAVMDGHTADVSAVAIAPDGSWLATSGEPDNLAGKTSLIEGEDVADWLFKQRHCHVESQGGACVAGGTEAGHACQ
jgi:WD40 repeat protein